jgi:ABC-type multidrug transport system fused ATPase/permease subunit
VIRDELSRLFSYQERHRRLFARLLLALALSLVVFVAGTSLVWLTEHGHQGGAINNIGDAAFFTSAQLLTVSSSMPNPVTGAGRVVDVVLEWWAIFVITAVAGSFATFFSSGDSHPRGDASRAHQE